MRKSSPGGVQRISNRGAGHEEEDGGLKAEDGKDPSDIGLALEWITVGDGSLPHSAGDGSRVVVLDARPIEVTGGIASGSNDVAALASLPSGRDFASGDRAWPISVLSHERRVRGRVESNDG